MTDDTVTSFDLRNEPWIPARLRSGATEELSLRAVFHRAEEIRELGGELPTQSFVILRLLLAIVARAAGPSFTEDEWVQWWEGGLPLTQIDAYLDKFPDRFDLLHPTRPFFQVADLHTAKGEIKDVSPLILDLPSNNRLFTTRAGAGAESLRFAEAARWLVNAQAFDASGIKSGAVGDDRVKGGKGYPIGVAWSGLIGGVVQEGDDLRETLLLNLVPAAPEAAATDIPPWEETEPDTAAARAELHPRGPVRLFTWQSRRIRLFSDGDKVTGCLIANGDALTPQNQFAHEPMTAWRYSEPQTKKAGTPTYMPREHRPERAFWRGISALLPTASHNAKGPEPTLRPGTAKWVGFLQEQGLIDDAKRIRMRAIGVVYGSNNSVVDEILDDHLSLAIALLGEKSMALAAEAENAVQLADSGVWALRRLAENLARAAGAGDTDGPQRRAGESAYAALGEAYRSWLAALSPDTSPEEAIGRWRHDALRVIRPLGADLIRDAGPAAWTGREVRMLGKTELVNTPRAESWFLSALHKTFGDTAGKERAS